MKRITSAWSTLFQIYVQNNMKPNNQKQKSWEEKLKPKVTMFPKFQSDRKVQEFALDILNQYWRDLKPEISLLLIKEREAVLKDLIENYMGNKTVSYDCIYIDELEKYLLDSIKSDE